MLRPGLAILLLSLCIPTVALGDLPVRVASYNIYFLKDGISDERKENLRETIDALGATVIGLQEIKDRAALEEIFPPGDWSIVIDDQSGDDQDLALVVKKPLKVLRRDGNSFDLDADDEDFLFPGQQFENVYRNRRDCLCVLVTSEDGADEFFFMVNHWKSRLGGRDVTDWQREEAGRLLANRIESDFDGKNVIIVGDFNDNPDDRSMNILETGIDQAVGGPEQVDGPLMINLMESLLVDDHCSWGVPASSLTPGGQLNTKISGTRTQNNQTRGTAGSVSPILFDQILIPMHMATMYEAGTVKVFDNPVARAGSGPNAETPSDHLPVFADFKIVGKASDGDGTAPVPQPAGTLRIVSMLVNPTGEDRGAETVTLKNTSTADVNLAGWKLRDRSGHELPLTDSIAAGAQKVVTDTDQLMPLNNNGDEVVLLNPAGNIVHRVTYRQNEVRAGEHVVFQSQ